MTVSPDPKLANRSLGELGTSRACRVVVIDLSQFRNILGADNTNPGTCEDFVKIFTTKNMLFFASLRDLIMATLQRDRKRREEKKPSTRRGGNQTHYFKSFDLQACAITTKLIG